MSYIGQQPLNNYVTKQSQTFTPDGSTVSFTLDFAVTSGIDIMLVINNVVQEPGAGKAYTASGTTLTMSEAPGASDSMYCIFLGLALQTVNPGDASVGTSKLTDSAVTTAKINNSAVTNAKIANSTIDLSTKVTGVLPSANSQANTPAFAVVPSAGQTITTSTDTVIQFGTESYDTDSCYDTGTYRFTPNVSGKYFLYVKIRFDESTDWEYNMVKIRKNGSDFARFNSRNDFYEGLILTKVLDANGTTDYFDFVVRQESGGNKSISSDGAECYAGGYKLIGV